MKKLTILLAFLFPVLAIAQTVTVEGYAFEQNNRGFLNEVEVVALDTEKKSVVASATTDRDGKFVLELPANRDYLLRGTKNVFKEKEITASTKGVKAGKKVFVKMEMERQPGYLLEMTLAEKWTEDTEEVEAIMGARVEVYNNTKREEELVLASHPSPTFSHNLEKGNHYTIMIRKEGFFTKRLEAYVDIDGCILCMDGVNEITPGQVGVSDNLTQGLQMGTLLANVELDRVRLDEALVFENIYYDYNKAEIRDDAAEELDKLVVILKDNPALLVELGSHTDSRGKTSYNQELSQKRAESAVRYITKIGGIEPVRIVARGYGESKLVNKCADGVECSDAKHQKNRRTELKVIGIRRDAYDQQEPLAKIIEQERFDQMVAETAFGNQYVAGEGGELPEDLQKELADKADEQGIADPDARVGDLSAPRGSLPETVQTRPGETAPTGGMIIPDEALVGNLPNDRLQLLPRNYSGFKVQIMITPDVLQPTHAIFVQHGSVTIERAANGQSAYLLGDFQNMKDAEWFMANVIGDRYPGAEIVKFENGSRAM